MTEAAHELCFTATKGRQWLALTGTDPMRTRFAVEPGAVIHPRLVLVPRGSQVKHGK